MATPQSRAARAKEMAERPDRQCPLAEQVPNESFWADQPGSHGLPSDVRGDGALAPVNHSFGHFFDCSASVPVPIVTHSTMTSATPTSGHRQATATVFGS